MVGNALIALVITLSLSGCEKRQATLLPPKDLAQKPNQASSGEMRARAVPDELQEPASQPEAIDDAEAVELERVKQQALRRIQSDEANPGGARSSVKGRQLFDRGRSLMAKGQFDKGIQYFLAACQVGYTEGCHRFGWHEERSGNPANAKQFYRLACDAGLNKSCNNLGVQLEKQRKWDEALDFYARACLNQHDISCNNLKRLRDERLRAR